MEEGNPVAAFGRALNAGIDAQTTGQIAGPVARGISASTSQHPL
jgi:hypothetical protein